MTIMCTGTYLVFDFFFHFQKKYKPTPDRIYTPMNIYIGFTLSPKSHAKNRLVAALNYLFLLIYANTTSTANMMMTIMCIGMPNKGYQLEMISLPIRLSKKYQVNQVNHEVGKKHHKHKTYKKSNILILIKIPCKYLVIIIPFPKVIPPCNYLVKHLLLQFYIWWLDYFFILTKCYSEINTMPLSNIRYLPLAKDFMLNLISNIKISHLFISPHIRKYN